MKLEDLTLEEIIKIIKFNNRIDNRLPKIKYGSIRKKNIIEQMEKHIFIKDGNVIIGNIIKPLSLYK